MVGLVLTAGQPEGPSHSLMCQWQSWLNYIQQQGTQRHTQGSLLEDSERVIRKTVPLSLSKHLLHKTTLPRLGDTADLPNI